MDDDNDSSNKNKSNLPIECQGDVSSLYHPHGPWTGISWDSNSSDCRSVERLGIHCSLFTCIHNAFETLSFGDLGRI